MFSDVQSVSQGLVFEVIKFCNNSGLVFELMNVTEYRTQHFTC